MLINGSQLNMLVYVRWLLLQERVPDGFRDQSHCTLIIFYISSTTGVVFLPAISSQERSRILLDIANALQANERLILAENEVDVAVAQQAGYEKTLISRLALKSEKISSLAKAICALANMEEPIGRVIKRTELADGLILEKISSPLRVLLIIFESRPEALVQIASLAIRSGNGLLLKGGKEAKRSNTVLHKVITSAIPQSVGEKLIGLVTSKEEIPDLLKLYDVIDLVIPRGSNKLVSQIKASTKIPVLGHADGIIHIYVDKSANMDMAKQIVLDAKTDYPATCNAMVLLYMMVGGIYIIMEGSAAVFHNASIRFCDGFRFGLGAEVGISISRIHAHGPVGVEGLLITRWIARGNGQIVDGDKGVVYTHKELTQ